MKKKIYRAGLIPYYIKNDEIFMLFMMPSDAKFGGREFQIAKGKVEPGESNEAAAIRESGEELGFTMLNADGNVTSLGNFLGRTAMFLCKIKRKDMFSDTDKETAKTKWMTEHEFSKVGRDLHKPVIKAAIRKIKSLED